MSTVIGETVAAVMERRVAALDQAFRRGKSEIILMAVAAQLATIGTNQSVETIFTLLERFRNNEEKLAILVVTMIACSPKRDAFKARLRDIFKDEASYGEVIEDEYELVRTSGKTFRSLGPIADEITRELEWKTDDSGD